MNHKRFSSIELKFLIIMRDIYNLSKICLFIIAGVLIAVSLIVFSKSKDFLVEEKTILISDIKSLKKEYADRVNSKYDSREEAYTYWDSLAEKHEIDYEAEIEQIKRTIQDVKEVKKLVVNKELEFISKLIFDLTQSDQSENFAILITDEAKKQGIDPLLVTAVILAESTFKIDARSKVGAIGLMQLMPRTAEYISQLKELGIESEEVKVPEQNIKLGVTYLKEMAKQFSGNLHLTLVAYNWGPGALTKALKTGRKFPRESINYSEKIRKHYNKWKILFNAAQ